MNDGLCSKYGCDYQLDLDGQVTCFNCGAMDDDASTPEMRCSGGIAVSVDNSVFERQIDFE